MDQEQKKAHVYSYPCKEAWASLQGAFSACEADSDEKQECQDMTFCPEEVSNINAFCAIWGIDNIKNVRYSMS